MTMKTTSAERKRNAGLEGLRILVVEDEHFIAMEIESQLLQLNCEVVGPAPRLKKALNIAAEASIDGALLDINLSGDYVYPLARFLREREIPFLFATGYEASDIPSEFRDVPRLQKPFSSNELAAALRRLFAAPRGDEL